MKGLDFSWARPGSAAIKAAGFEFVQRYVPYQGNQGKGLTAAEIADYRANGLAIGVVFESTAGRHLDGMAAGADDAKESIRVLDAIGFPGELPIYFAVDFDATAAQMDAIDQYQLGAQSVLGKTRVGIYGSYAVIDHCWKAGTAHYLWQTYAWSGGKTHPERHLYQYSNGEKVNGQEVDYNYAYGTDQGLWLPEGSTDMGMTAEERAEMDAFKRAVFAGSEQPGDEAARTAYANFKIGEGGQSVNDTAQSAIAVALKQSGAIQPGMTKEAIEAVVAEELRQARIVLGG